MLREAARINPAVPWLAISGNPLRMMDTKEFNLQDDDLIPKPFSPGVLVSKIRDVLDRSRP